MASKGNQLFSRARGLARHPRTHKIAIWLVSVIVAFGVLIGLVAPPLLRGWIAGDLSERLHREVTIEQIRLNPYAMTATIRGFLMKERNSQATALSFDELHVNLELQSVLRLGPVIKEARLVKPYVNVVRNEDSKYNFQDLIDEFTSGPSGGPTPRFSLNNIQIIDGKIDFDDRPEQTQHSISSIHVGVPFVSSLPSYTDIFVKPSFSANINGAPLHIGGESKPFHRSHESIVDLDIDKLHINKYLEYSPLALNFKVPSGELNGKLNASFKTAKNSPSVFTITGNLALTELAVEKSGGSPVGKIANLEVVIDAIDVFNNKTGLKSIKAQGLELHLARNRDGSLSTADLVTTSPKTTQNEPKTDSKPFGYEISEILIESGTLHFTDETLQRPYKTRLDNVRIAVKGLTNEPAKQADIEVSFESDAKERVGHSGKIQLSPFLAEGKLDVERFKLGNLSPYYQDVLATDIKEGSLDLSTQYRFEAKGAGLTFTDLNANLRTVRLELPGQPEPLWRIPSLAIKDATVDVTGRTVVIGALEGKGGIGYVQRAKDGTLNYARIVKAQSATPATKEPTQKNETSWKVEAKQIALDGFRVNVDDRAAATPAKLNLSNLSVRIRNFSSAKNQSAKATLRTRINNKGTLRLAGAAGANPITAKFAVEGQDIELLPFQPYLGDQVNFLLTGGRLSTKGSLLFDASGSPSKVSYQGGAQLADFAAVEKGNTQDLLNWKALSLDEILFNSEPLQLRIGTVNLAHFYSRLIIGPDGKVNLQNLTVPDEKQDAAAPETIGETAATTPATTEKPITIGKINLQGGNINFSDFLIKPNYSANLTDVEGTVSELKPETPGDLDLKAKLDGAAPVDINGKINPLATELFFDIVADAREIEMNSFSPYSGKYIGYGIDKGKLSFNVKYKVENRKLTAENKIILNQLTFGEKVESPQATKLPVLLAVALLKDRNGVIDINLPISGSLDEPQFSVGGIILRLVINIITKAVTAPFALLGGVFGGGGGEELSYVEFDNGRATLNQAAQAKIATLVKAMSNRPALRLELSGRADPASDVEGLKRWGIERKVKAQKLKDLSRKGEAPKSLDEVKIDSSEYPQYLKAAYGEEDFPKPRNIIGLARDLPVPEMEKLMMQHATANDDDLRQLANQRAQTVRDALLATGQVSADRLFIVAAKPLTSEEKSKLKGKPNRVDFSLR
ncbi:MAG: DUF748 domain-containing protein [Deltaproteobacteria bacterium]|nr:DUF748 domain-containing protein [Deltaproteobacteria bacterium]